MLEITAKGPYGILQSSTLEDLTKMVTVKMAEGYEPLGAPFYSHYWSQAMVSSRDADILAKLEEIEDWLRQLNGWNKA